MIHSPCKTAVMLADCERYPVVLPAGFRSESDQKSISHFIPDIEKAETVILPQDVLEYIVDKWPTALDGKEIVVK